MPQDISASRGITKRGSFLFSHRYDIGHSFKSLCTNRRDRGTEAWFQELAQEAEAEGDAAFYRPRVLSLENPASSHVFSAEERRRMDKYESIDYGEPQSLLYKARMAWQTRERRWLKWVMFIAVGIVVGLWSVLLFQTLELVSSQKLKLLQDFMVEDDHTKNFSETGSQVTAPAGGPSWKGIAKGYLLYAFWGIFAAMLSSLCCLVMPSAAGSGVPEVMAYLNGIMFPRIFNIRNLVVKTLSCILAVTSGLPVGAEGPIIHIGSLIGAGLPTGRSRTLRCAAGSLLTTFRNPRDMRDFISAGAACGMTSAFSAPIGGMLFVMEEVATFFPVRLACMVFVSCLSCICVIQIINTHLSGWKVVESPSKSPGDFCPSAVSMFIVDVTRVNRVPMNLLTFIPTVFGAIALGLLSVSYTVSSVKFTRWRSKRLFSSAFLRVLEPCVAAFVYATVCYTLPLAFDCAEIPRNVKDNMEKLNIKLFTAYCADRENTFSPLGTLALTSPYNGIRVMFLRHSAELIPWHACLLHLLLYTVASSYASGMFISCGNVIPSLFIGALGGRVIGLFFGNKLWADPGLIALIGTASYFSGISRLSFSLIVIMMELTSDLTHITCLMVGVIVARALANRCCHSFYHSLLEVKAAPFLEAQASVHKLDMFSARDIMTSPPVTLETLVPMTRILDVLQSTTHNCFPVVSTSKKTYTGVISRSQLELLLWLVYFRDSRGAAAVDGAESESSQSSCVKATRSWESAPTSQQEQSRCEAVAQGEEAAALRWLEQQPHATHAELREVSERVFWQRLPPYPPVEYLPAAVMRCYVSLVPYVDCGAYYVRDVVCISRSYHVFRYLGLRQLPILDSSHRVVGVITRKNFVADRLHERLQLAAESAKREAHDRAQWLYKNIFSKSEE